MLTNQGKASDNGSIVQAIGRVNIVQAIGRVSIVQPIGRVSIVQAIGRCWHRPGNWTMLASSRQLDALLTTANLLCHLQLTKFAVIYTIGSVLSLIRCASQQAA